MSQIVKMLKKQTKNVGDKEKLKTQHPQSSENENGSREESAEYEDKISEPLENLPAFCDYLERVIATSNDILQAAYRDQYPRALYNHLKSEVNELMCLQKEIRTILENISSMQIQLAAVKLNIEAHKNKLKAVRSEERRTRFLLTTESNKQEKNLHNQKETNRNRSGRYIVTPSGNSMPSSSGATIGTSNPVFVSVPGASENEHDNKPVKGANSKTFAVKKTKHNRNKERGSENGVTIYLRPISELEKSESSHSPRSRHSTPNTSIVNFSWLSAPESHTMSDTATESIISDSNSLFVFSSDGQLDDLD